MVISRYPPGICTFMLESHNPNRCATAAAAQLLQNMSPEQRAKAQQMYGNLSDEQRQELTEQAKKMGFFKKPE